MKFVKWILITILGVSAFVAWQTHNYYGKALPMNSYRIVTVTEESTIKDVARELETKEVIDSAQEFVMWARLMGHDRKLKAGEYGIPVGISLSGLFDILLSGKSLGHRLVVPEGTNMYEIAQKLESLSLCRKEHFVELATNKAFITKVLGDSKVDSLEGYLFPDTYFFTKVDGCKVIARRMVGHFLERFKSVGTLPGWTRHEIVTLGSIIEKETGATFERPQISSVFHNRLQKKMRLQTDPTVIYAHMLRTGKYSMNITRTDLLTDHPYNTYTRKGLPPGPISNPGFAALKAVIQPATTDYLFFVSRNDGTHVFSKNYKDHTSAVSSFQLDPKAREGKSWRDLSKRAVNGEEIEMDLVPAPLPMAAPAIKRNVKRGKR